MKEISINGQVRESVGKKATKLMRKEGLVPCNLYGETKGENLFGKQRRASQGNLHS